MKTESSDFERRDHGRLEIVARWLALLAILLHGTQFSFDVLANITGAQLNLCAVDFILWAAFWLWLIGRIQRKDGSRLAISIPAVIGAVWLVLSLVPQLKGGAAERIEVTRSGWVNAIQFAEYFIVGHILFVAASSSSLWRRRVIAAIALATLAAVACAWIQYFSPSLSVTDVSGTWFENRNTFGAYLVLAVPLLFGVALFGRMRFGRMAMLLMTAGGLCVCLSAGAFLGLCVALVVVAFLRGSRYAFITIAALCMLCVYVIPHLPRKNGTVLVDSVLLYREDDPHRIFGEDVIDARARLDAKERRLTEKIQQGSPVAYGDRISEEDRSWKWQQRYKEWQAAVNMMRLSPVFGVGAGAYQENVKTFYDMPKPPVQLLEPDTLSFYMIWGASAGVPFLFIVLSMFMKAMLSSGRALRTLRKPLDRGLAAGLVGSMAGLVVVGLFGDPMVRGVGVTLALLLALAQALGEDAYAIQEDQT